MTLAILKDLEKQLTDYEELILTAPKRHIKEKIMKASKSKKEIDIVRAEAQLRLITEIIDKVERIKYD